MKISELYSAMREKVRLDYEDSNAEFQEGNLIRIEPSHSNRVFRVSQYGKGVKEGDEVYCKASENTANYLRDLYESQRDKALYCMFMVDGVEPGNIQVQVYTFQSMTEYETPIRIIMSAELRATAESLSRDYIWDQLGRPAIFCLNYKDRKKQNANVRFAGGKKYLIARNTQRGIIAEKISYDKFRYEVPVDLFIAPKIEFVPIADAEDVNDELSENLERFSSSKSYFARWEAYDALSKKVLDEECEEFGEIPYKAYDSREVANGRIYDFHISQRVDDSITGKEVAASEKETVEAQVEQRAGRRRQYSVGKIRKATDSNIETFLPDNDTDYTIPKTGVLELFSAGDRFIMARREKARDRIREHRSPIRYLAALIEAGASGYISMDSWGTHKAITEKLRKNFDKTDRLNPEQIQAINMAINTPDIALIQGPPGTGKTTVIKAIAERFREIYEADQRQMQKTDPDHMLSSPQILISSFQNDAVDNAISAPLAGDLPAYRKTGKRTNDNSKAQYQKALDKWYNGLKTEIDKLMENDEARRYLECKRRLDDEFLSYKNAGEPIDQAAALIERYLDYADIHYTNDLVNEAKAIIAANSNKDDDETENRIIRLIESQRTAPEAFEDDGAINASRLAAFIRNHEDLQISENILTAIMAVRYGDYSENEFKAYVDAVSELKRTYCRGGYKIDPRDKETINRCILSLSNAFSTHYLDTLSTLEGKKALILSEFLAQLEQEYESIVKEYSMTTAATCQTSLNLREDDAVFDLVIIDEAARANPLDLFIPMSMGRKIVLVGDHKQLPHMLEPDILKMLTEDPRYQDIPEIEKSLFERLFEMFSNGQTPKALPLTRQYRMHPDICRFVSEAFYDNVLQTADCITAEMRASNVAINDGQPLVYVNIPISMGAETPGMSKSRPAEVEVIAKDVRHILDEDPSASIGIITFYSEQAKLLKKRVLDVLDDEQRANVEIGTVDAFQGKEFDYVLLSCVRSNTLGKDKKPVVGFLEKPNRLCVAFSRSIRQLAVYGDANTLNQIPCFQRLYDICTAEKGGCYREY